MVVGDAFSDSELRESLEERTDASLQLALALSNASRTTDTDEYAVESMRILGAARRRYPFRRSDIDRASADLRSFRE